VAGNRAAGGLRARRVVVRAFLLAIMGAFALLLPASPASAHAALLTSNPAPGSVIGASPTEITVTFSEAITPVSGRIQVLAPDGKRISGTATASGAVLRIPVR
jgi:copper transport protein